MCLTLLCVSSIHSVASMQQMFTGLGPGQTAVSSTGIVPAIREGRVSWGNRSNWTPPISLASAMVIAAREYCRNTLHSMGGAGREDFLEMTFQLGPTLGKRMELAQGEEGGDMFQTEDLSAQRPRG